MLLLPHSNMLLEVTVCGCTYPSAFAIRGAGELVLLVRLVVALHELMAPRVAFPRAAIIRWCRP